MRTQLVNADCRLFSKNISFWSGNFGFCKTCAPPFLFYSTKNTVMVWKNMVMVWPFKMVCAKVDFETKLCTGMLQCLQFSLRGRKAQWEGGDFTQHLLQLSRAGGELGICKARLSNDTVWQTLCSVTDSAQSVQCDRLYTMCNVTDSAQSQSQSNGWRDALSLCCWPA